MEDVSFLWYTIRPRLSKKPGIVTLPQALVLEMLPMANRTQQLDDLLRAPSEVTCNVMPTGHGTLANTACTQERLAKQEDLHIRIRSPTVEHRYQRPAYGRASSMIRTRCLTLALLLLVVHGMTGSPPTPPPFSSVLRVAPLPRLRGARLAASASHSMVVVADRVAYPDELGVGDGRVWMGRDYERGMEGIRRWRGEQPRARRERLPRAVAHKRRPENADGLNAAPPFLAMQDSFIPQPVTDTVLRVVLRLSARVLVL
ncbi:hypothetical protein C8R45DRAFT_1077795 [Mycena sanguinolenta]|nr:hypothetical protein C8R45DRAFT_1077795 [Mycena sanguinolenta]